MGRTAGSRLLSPSDLVGSSPAELELAWRHREALVAAASTLVVAAGHDPDLGACADAGCRLVGLDDDQALCGTAHRLARLPTAPVAVRELPLEVATAGFVAALTATADAVRHCRRTRHPATGCWFSPVAGLDGCGPVLRLLHRLG